MRSLLGLFSSHRGLWSVAPSKSVRSQKMTDPNFVPPTYKVLYDFDAAEEGEMWVYYHFIQPGFLSTTATKQQLALDQFLLELCVSDSQTVSFVCACAIFLHKVNSATLRRSHGVGLRVTLELESLPPQLVP